MLAQGHLIEIQHLDRVSTFKSTASKKKKLWTKHQTIGFLTCYNNFIGSCKKLTLNVDVLFSWNCEFFFDNLPLVPEEGLASVEINFQTQFKCSRLQKLNTFFTVSCLQFRFFNLNIDFWKGKLIL